MMIIRKLSPDDFSAWLPLWRGYLEFYGSEVSDEVTRHTFDRLVGAGEGMGAFVAEDEAGGLIGLVHWLRHPSTWTREDYCYLQDLFVSPAGRGQGVGRALIEVVYGRAAELKCNRVYWLTHETNETAMQLYDRVAERSGFVQYRKVL